MAKYKGKFNKATKDLAKKVAEEFGILQNDLLRNVQRVAAMRKSNSGKYTVLGIDKFSGDDWLYGEYDTAEEALRKARELTKEGMKSASDSSVATVYYAYDPSGLYLGGDTWSNE